MEKKNILSGMLSKARLDVIAAIRDAVVVRGGSINMENAEMGLLCFDPQSDEDSIAKARAFSLAADSHGGGTVLRYVHEGDMQIQECPLETLSLNELNEIVDIIEEL